MIEKIKESLYEQMNINRHINHDDIINVGLEQALSIINQIEHEYADGWIPVGERLPEERVNVLACNLTGFICIAKLSGDSWLEDAWLNNVCVDAWMPLPDPYKEV